MIRIAIVEDEERCASELRRMLERYQQERRCDLSITAFADGEQITRNYRPDYDIILMDVQMELMDGMTAAELIRKQDPEVILIFMTNMAQYAIRGYAVDALDYVLKPVSYFAFSQRLDRAIDRLERMERNKTSYLSLAVKGGTQKLDISRIRYVESRGHTLIFHLKREEISAGGTRTEMENQHSDFGFARCNKGYLINLAYVDAVRDGCAVLGDDMMLISRGRKTAFLQQLTDYMGGQTR